MVLHIVKDSKTINILLEIRRSFVNELWCSVIMWGRIFFNMFANTLEKNLVQHITQANGAKLRYQFRIFNLGD